MWRIFAARTASPATNPSARLVGCGLAIVALSGPFSAPATAQTVATHHVGWTVSNAAPAPPPVQDGRIVSPSVIGNTGLTGDAPTLQTLRPTSLVIPFVDIGPDDHASSGPHRDAADDSSAANPSPLDPVLDGAMPVGGNRFYISGAGVMRPDGSVAMTALPRDVGILLIDSAAEPTQAE